MDKERHMRAAIRLSIAGMRGDRGGPFGAVVVRDGEIVARGWNRVTSTRDPTAHAEIIAIRRACRKLGTFDLGDCELYTSCEPCPMCMGATYWARLRALYYANTREDAAQVGFDDERIYREIALPSGQRTIPTEQLLRTEAIVAFDEWRGKDDRVRY